MKLRVNVLTADDYRRSDREPTVFMSGTSAALRQPAGRSDGSMTYARLAIALIILVALFTNWSFAPSRAAASSVDLLPIADATVEQSAPTTYFGDEPTLQVDGSPVKDVFLQFSVPQNLGTITSATLSFYVTDASKQGGDLYSVTNTNWAESVTWNTKPTIDGPKIASLAAVKRGTTTSIDVTSAISGMSRVAFALTSSASDGADYGSRESAHPPKLTIQLSGDAPPVTTSVVNPVVDATVAQASPQVSLGTKHTLEVDASPVKDVYLRFDVPKIDAMVVKATLTFAVVDSSDHGGDIYTVSNTTWDESITWNNRPAIDGSYVGSIGRVRAHANVSADVTGAISGPGLVSLALTSFSSDGADYASRETATPPKLTIEWEAYPSLSLPVRAAFYYPWYPSAWNQQGYNPFTRYQPTLGYYNSSDTSVIAQHVAWMQQAGIQAAIVSWWGIGHSTDVNLHKALNMNNNGFKWAIYHEQEGTRDLTQDEIRTDLTYLETTAFNDPDYLRVDGKPVVFVYNTDNTDASVAERWVPVAKEFNVYLSLKVFGGYRTITPQPDSWHQYAPSSRIDHQAGYSTTISPGFWRPDEATPRLPRDETAYAAAVQQMATNNDPWQLITTFNEWGEGTAIEPSTDWGTDYIRLTAGESLTNAPNSVISTALALRGEQTRPSATVSGGNVSVQSALDWTAVTDVSGDRSSQASTREAFLAVPPPGTNPNGEHTVSPLPAAGFVQAPIESLNTQYSTG